MLSRLCLSLVALTCVAGGTVASRAARNPEEPVQAATAEKASASRGQEMVKVAFTARDRKNRLVLDLTQEELRLFEDGTEQKIEYFSPELSLPLSLGLLIDLSGSQ